MKRHYSYAVGDGALAITLWPKFIEKSAVVSGTLAIGIVALEVGIWILGHPLAWISIYVGAAYSVGLLGVEVNYWPNYHAAGLENGDE